MRGGAHHLPAKQINKLSIFYGSAFTSGFAMHYHIICTAMHRYIYHQLREMNIKSNFFTVEVQNDRMRDSENTDKNIPWKCIAAFIKQINFLHKAEHK
jgi:hypothetical protein